MNHLAFHLMRPEAPLYIKPFNPPQCGRLFWSGRIKALALKSRRATTAVARCQRPQKPEQNDLRRNWIPERQMFLTFQRRLRSQFLAQRQRSLRLPSLFQTLIRLLMPPLATVM